MTHLKIVYVEWADSETLNGWEPINSRDEELPLAYSVGVYLNETEEFLELAHSVDPKNEAANGRIKIPLSAIKKCRTLCQVQLKTKK